MYYLRGYDAVMGTVQELAEVYSAGPLDSLAAIRTGYVDFINHVQTLPPFPHADQPLYQLDTDIVRQLLAHYGAECMLTDLKDDVVIADLSAMTTALAVIESQLVKLLVIEPRLHDVFMTVIHTLFYARSTKSGGGSVSSALGVIWCGHRKDWTGNDVLEFLVHELTHNLVFLDEYRYVHWVDLELIADHENWARSTILKCPRPMDKVFHSLVVAHEVLSFRRQVGEPISPQVHPASLDILKNALDTVESIYSVVERVPLVTPRVLEVTALIERNLRTWQQQGVGDIVGV
jgi:hypothetical protein